MTVNLDKLSVELQQLSYAFNCLPLYCLRAAYWVSQGAGSNAIGLLLLHQV
jgi:hypothetical protein